MSDDLKVYKSACRMCHGGCGVLVHVQDGKVIKVSGDHESPINQGKLCVKGLASVEHLYHEDRLKYPLKRSGERGSGQWERISWDEAYEIIVARINKIKTELGPEAITIAQGTGRHHLHHTVRFANILGTPNWMEPGTAQCFFPRVKTGEITYGCLPVCDYYGEVNPACVLVWGHNPIICGADGESQFRVQECIRKGTKLIVIDPRKTEMAEKAEIWLQLRPGTDDALALSLLNVIINENLYDRDFVEKWTVGFESLKERVQQYTPEWVEKITWVPAEKIRQAARLFATTKPATLEWGVALEQTPNCFQTVRAVALLPGITGNFDVPGGWIEGMHLLPDPDTLQERIPFEMKAKRLGSDRFQFLAGADQVMPSAHIPSVLRAMRTGEPYQVRALMCFGNNGLLGFGDTKNVYQTLLGLDFILVMDLYMTPTAELADIVLPAASWLELDQVFGVPSLADHVVLAQQKITSVWECKPDEEVFLELAKRLGLDYGAETVEDIFNHQLADTGRRFAEFRGIDFQQLKQKSFISVPIKYRKYEERGFNTPSGKMELYSSILEKYGYDPLPYYEEPPESPLSDPELANEYPLILTTGGRVKYFFHSEYRQIPSLRKYHPDPIVEIHPETAAKYGIVDGEWAWIESKRGRIQQKVKVTTGIAPGVINCQHGWWFPEDTSPEHGVWKSNANVLTKNAGPYDPIIGTYQLRALLCKVYPVM